jgi:hypothetical protein
MAVVQRALPFVLALLTLLVQCHSAIAQPVLELSRPTPNTARVTWQDAQGEFSLESAGALGSALLWENFPANPVIQGATRSVDLPIGNQTRFFRLRSAGSPVLVTIASTSPNPGETAVSVTRETVFQLTGALGPNVTVNTNQLYAISGGRRILSRVEISNQRDLVSLFYMENLPSGARVEVTFDGSGLTDLRGLPIDLDNDRQPGGEAKLTFETVNTTVLANTAVIGRVLASEKGPNGEDVPLRNVTITVDGMEETVRTTTAADGSFTLEPAPSGKFFVNIDGRTAAGSNWPNGAYYPLLGKGWEAVPGKTNNLAVGSGIIYLPLIAAGTLKNISASTDTVVTFPESVVQQMPELQGVEIVVPPNGLFSDNGSRGGMVGLAPVASDRLPEPLPAGLTHALDISIQTSGPQNFTGPVPAKFPNLPDPVTGQKLPPGAKTALWSFNHDTGRWEMQGPMTVTEDGNFVVTDPGVGIRQPGWHGTSPGSSGDGGPGGPEPCSPGGILAPGTSECDDDGPCPDDIGESKRNMDLCTFTAGNCALRCFKKCGTGGAITKIWKALKLGYECNKAAQCADRCKEDGKKCKDKWERCFLGGFGFLPQRAGTVQAFAAQDAAVAEANRIMADLEHHTLLWNAIYAILDKAPTADELSPQDQAAALAIAQQLDSIYGGKAPEEYYAERERRFAQLILQSPLADTVYPPISGYYAIEDLETGLIRRGRTEPRGYLNGIILRPNAPYRIRLLLGKTLVFHEATFRSAGAGQNTVIPYGEALMPPSLDLDADGIPAVAEFVLGTRDDRADSDNDGINDLQELKNGTNPLDGAPPINGVIAALDTPGNAVDVAAEGTIALIADSAAGAIVVDVTDPLRPTMLARWDTPGIAQGVALALPGAAIADGTGGLVLLDLTIPARPVLARTVAMPGQARAVTIADNTAYAGGSDGTILAADLISGSETARLALPGGPRIEDLVVEGNYLYAWAAGRLHVLSRAQGLITYLRAVDGQVSAGTGTRRMRLNISGDKAYAVYPAGVVIFGLANPEQPVVLQRRGTQQNGFKHVVLAMPNLAVAADGLAPTESEPQDLSVYGLGANGTELNFLANFRTPGVSSAVAIHRGYAFLADGLAGLQIVNFAPADTAGVAPAIELLANFSLNPAQIESGQRGRVTALASDDVMVREVEFHLNDQLVSTDSSWPFRFEFTAPALTPSVQNIRLRARAIDTAGNATWTPEYVIQLLPDQTPPRVTSSSPQNGGVVDELARVLARFSEPVDFATITSANLRLISAGPDLLLGTPDDFVVQGIPEYLSIPVAAVFTANTFLPNGLYRFEVQDVRDLAGNALANPFSSTFYVAPGGPNGDADGDGLTNAQEGEARTNPFQVDTDGDGWADEVEVNDRTDPRDPNTFPRMVFAARPTLVVEIKDPREDEPAGPFIARPSVEAAIAASEELAAPGPIIAQPAITVEVSSFEEVAIGTIVARPDTTLFILPFDEPAPAPIVARPPVSATRANP